MSQVTINTTTRTEFGKNAAGRLRRAGILPCNLLDAGKATSLQLLEKDLSKLLSAGLRQSSVIQLTVDGKDERCIVKEIQRDPVTSAIEHVDFYRVAPGRRVNITVAIEVVGQAKGVKAGGSLEHYVRQLKIRATPETFMETVQLDVSNLDVGEGIRLKDLPIPDSWDVFLQGNPMVVRIAHSRATATEAAPAGAPAAAAAGKK